MKNIFTRILILLPFLLSMPHALAQDAEIEFEALEEIYYVGEIVEVELVERAPLVRTEKIDLWFAVLMPTNDLIFITAKPDLFNLQAPFETGVETTEIIHTLLEFEVPPKFAGNYTLYAIYVEENKNPLVDENVVRSNLAVKTITLRDESSDDPFTPTPTEPSTPDDPPDDPLPNPFAMSFTFTPLSHVAANTDYISNPVTISGVEGSVDAMVSGGIATLVKNGVETGSQTTRVDNGDTLAIKTRSSPTADNVNITLTVGEKSTTWTVTTAAIQPLPEMSGKMSGYSAGEFQVNESGAATYAMPITVSPGTAGIQPNLSIAYSSQGGNGLLGTGFSLSGLSAIARCPATRAQDNGLIDPVDFDDNDRFCLDGERLMAVQGAYGADGTVYYTEQNSFRRVISYSQVGNGPEKFTVWTKSGLKMEYGHTADSRIEAQGKNSVLFWVLNKIQDTKGNYLTVFYEENNANGEYLPKRIDYTGNVNTGLNPYNSVQFFYENRQDVVPKYIVGSLLKTSKRLSRIETYEGADIFRKYQLVYQEGAVTKRSQLVSVTECGTDNSCFAPTTFGWLHNGEKSFTAPEMWINHYGANTGWANGSPRMTADVNGDGLPDIVGFGEAGVQVSLSTSTGFTSPELWVEDYGYNAGWRVESHPRMMADVNGDGLADIVGFGGLGVYVSLSTGKNFTASGLWVDNDYGSDRNVGGWKVNDHPRMMADVNGDGLADIVGFANAGVRVSLSTGTGFISSELWVNNFGYSQSWRVGSHPRMMADVNGDGLADVVGFGGAGVYVSLSTGKDFTETKLWVNDNYGSDGNVGGWSGDHPRMMADVNGDGLADIVGFANAGVRVSLATGTGFTSSELWVKDYGYTAGAWRVGNHPRMMTDVNGDGLADVVGFGNAGVQVSLSTGTGFTSSELWVNNFGDSQSWIVSNHPRMMTDVNGDGIADIVGFGGAGVYVSVSRIESPELLATITNGHTATTKINYKPLTNNSVYTKENNAVYPQVDVQMPLYVVSSYKVTNGIGGENRISYHYQGAKMDLAGRGFRGFSKTTVTDNTTGINNTIYYERDYRYLSTKIRRTEQRLADGTLIAETDNLSELKDYGNGVHFSRVKQSTDKKYEAAGSLKGQLLTTTITTNQFDDYGNPTKIVVDHGNGYTETTDNTYTNDTVNWILGRLTKAVVTKNAPGQPAQTRSSAFEYDPASGLLTKEIIEPNHPSLELVKSYQHDMYGNIQISSISGIGIEPRSHRTDYDDKGRYVIKSENALGHKETKIDNMGNLISLTGPNGLTTRWEYDGFGRTTLETRADGTQTRTAYRLCDATCPSNSQYFVRTETSGAAQIIAYYDILDREIRKETVGFDGRAIYIDQQYNARGEVTQVSEPYFSDDTPLWTINEYDAISRPVKETAPGDRVSTTDYQGLTTIVTNALGQKNTRTVNVLGQLIKSIDNLDNAITYIYDGFGNLIELRDPANNVTQMQYDIRGNKISMYDADTGQTSYIYNALGELISQTDANGQTVTMAYDKLGRMFYRNEAEGASEWTYDTEPKGIGKLAMVKGPNGYKETYRYDSFGRLVETQTELENQGYFVSKTYDQYGRADTLTYPTGFAIQNAYNKFGYLEKVQHVSDNALYWQAKRMNARGQLEQLTLGNGASTDKVYDQLTGRLQSIKTGNGTIQSLGFNFDKLGNLTERTNYQSNLSETFQYDNLNRLTKTKVDHYSTSIQYDKLGNITHKSDVGDYTYGTKPHAVISVNGVINTQYRYDANGNRISSSVNGQQIEYTSFNKPRRITQGDNLLEFQYGPTYRRYEQKVTRNGLLTTTNYIGGGIFEREVSQNWEKHTHYIFAGGESVAIYIDKNHGIEQETRYLHKDHLGSIDTITNEQGDVVEQLSFDAWGKRRDPDTWGALTEDDLLALLDEDLTTDRGFTGHEHLDEVQLIHTNGRVYDPVIGRFLSADPIVQAPTFSQSLNRYSYVMNNPLSLVDPSGFSWWSDKVKPAFNKYGKPVVAAIAGAALAVVTGGLASGLVGAILSGAGFGFGSAFTGTLLYGGSIGDAFKAGFKGAVIGGVTAGGAYGVGKVIGGIAKGFKDWKHGKISVYDVGSDGIPRVTNFVRDKIFLNGMQNKLSVAAQRGLEQYGGQPFTLIHNPSHGFIADLTESILGKIVGPSNVSKQFAGFLQTNGGFIRELTVHSQGAIIAKNTFGILAGKGVKLHNLTVTWNGAAINKLTAMASVKSIGANMGAFNVHFFDLVPNVVGMNGINGRVPLVSLLSIPMSMVVAPTLAMGPKISPHTVYP